MSLLEPPATLVDLLRSSLPATNTKEGTEDEIVDDDVLAYVAFLAAGLAHANNFEPDVWKEVLEPYLEQATSHSTDDQVIPDFCMKAEQALNTDDASSYGGDEDDKADMLCDVRFNLAYGGKILLHKTHLRLVRGRRYALVGQNGVGKVST
jgi:elongation factor 3